MDPIKFQGANCVLTKPTTDNGINLKDNNLQVEALHVLKCEFANGIPAFVSCWELSDADIERIIKERKVWCTILSRSAPPISLQTFRPFALDSEGRAV